MAMEDGASQLPHPLSEELLQEVLQELPTGARLATETCYTCWKENKFPTTEFLSFLRSISTHSKILKRLFPAEGGDAESESTQEKPETEGSSPIIPSPLDPDVMGMDAELSDNETDRQQHQQRLSEIQRRRLESFPGSLAGQTSRYLQWVMVELRGLLPASAKAHLLHAVRRYNTDMAPNSAQVLAKTVKDLVDAHNVKLPLVYAPHRTHEPLGATEGKKRAQPDKEAGHKKSSGALQPPKAKKKSLQQGGGDDGSVADDDKDLSDEELMVLSKQLGRQLGGPSKFTSCEDLRDTFLGQFLASRARAVSSRDVVVKVVADVLKQPHLAGTRGAATSGGLPCRSKALFAFLRVDNSPHFVLCFGMYVHEYGPGSAPAHASRVYVECVDSVPLYGKEKGEERQSLLSTIVLAYFEFVRDMGFRYAHMRVPPPTDENSHIFASRSLIVRLRASLHLAHWFKRLLATAQQNGTVTSYEAAATGNMPNFPLSLLHPGEMAAELAFRNVDLRTLDPQSQQLMHRVTQLKERFFVISLQRDEAPKPHTPDSSPLLDSAVAADRCELVGVCISQRLRFATVQQAKYATMMLVHRMEAEQVQSAAQASDMPPLSGQYPTHQADGKPAMAGHMAMSLSDMGLNGEAVRGAPEMRGMRPEMGMRPEQGMRAEMGMRPEAPMRPDMGMHQDMGVRPDMLGEVRAGGRSVLDDMVRGSAGRPGMRPEEAAYSRMGPAAMAAMEMGGAPRVGMRGMVRPMGGGEFGGWGYPGNGMEEEMPMAGPRGRVSGAPSPAPMPHQRYGPGMGARPLPGDIGGRPGEGMVGRMEGGPGVYGGMLESELRARAQAEAERRRAMHQHMSGRVPGMATPPGMSMPGPGGGGWMPNEHGPMQGRGGQPVRGSKGWEEMQYAAMGMGPHAGGMEGDARGGAMGTHRPSATSETARVQREMAMMAMTNEKQRTSRGYRGDGPPDSVIDQAKEMTRSAQSFADSFMVDLDPAGDGPLYGQHSEVGPPPDNAGANWTEDGADPSLLSDRGVDSDEGANWGPGY